MTAYQMWISYYTMMRKEIVRLFRIWSQTFLPPVITSALYFIVFGTFIGSKLPPIHGHTYIEFIVPGLIMMQVITSAYMHTVSTFFFAKFVHNLDELIVSPTPAWLVIFGFVSGGVLRGLIVAALVGAVALFFTHLAIYNLGILLLTVLLTSVLFSLGGLINGVFAKGFEGMNYVPTFLLTPLTFLGGVFYSVQQFTPLWQMVSKFNPILYMVNAFRWGFLGVSDISLGICYAVLVGFSVLFALIVWWLFRTGKGLRV